MKQKLLQFIAVLSYHSGLCALFYWLNRKAKRILTFHNVLPDAMFREGVANGVSTSLSCFEKIVDECKKKFEFSTDLFDARTLTITFDDGYRNQYTTAFASLRRRGIPAYLFVSGDCLTEKTRHGCHLGLVIDQITHWIDNVPTGLYVLGPQQQVVEICDEGRSDVWENVLWPMFMNDGENMGRGVLEACNRAYPIKRVIEALPTDYVSERLAGVTWAECEEMISAGWKIGWHTKSHYPLSRLSADDVEHELNPPAALRNECLSYPYGNWAEVGEEAVRMARQMGYPCAVSNTNESSENAAQFFLPRMTLSADRYMMHLELSGLKFFLKKFKLLPQAFKC